MQLIEADHWHALIKHVTAVDPELVTVCRWLACGPQMAPLVLGQDVRAPSPTEIQRLIGALDTAPPEAAAAGHALLAERSRGLAKVEVALGRLIEAGEAEWSPPPRSSAARALTSPSCSMSAGLVSRVRPASGAGISRPSARSSSGRRS